MLVDQSFSNTINKASIALYQKYFAPTAHLLWPGKTIITTEEKNTLLNDQRRIIFHPQQSYFRSDFGVVYGTCAITPALKISQQSGCFVHARVEKEASKPKGWQLLHETIK